MIDINNDIIQNQLFLHDDIFLIEMKELYGNIKSTDFGDVFEQVNNKYFNKRYINMMANINCDADSGVKSESWKLRRSIALQRWRLKKKNRTTIKKHIKKSHRACFRKRIKGRFVKSEQKFISITEVQPDI